VSVCVRSGKDGETREEQRMRRRGEGSEGGERVGGVKQERGIEGWRKGQEPGGEVRYVSVGSPNVPQR
jgi:hypothetical protein